MKQIIVLFISASLIGILGGQEVSAEETMPTNLNYSDIYGTVASDIYNQLSAQDPISADYLEYALYDMDGDGYQELLIQNGTCTADMVYEVYTTNGDEAFYIGQTIGADVTLYEKPMGTGIYSYYARDTYTDIELLTISEGQLVEAMAYNSGSTGGVVPPKMLGDMICTGYIRDGITENPEKSEDIPYEEESSSSVDYTGDYINGTDSDSDYIQINQNGDLLSYNWLRDGVLIHSGNNLHVQGDGSVQSLNFTFSMIDESTLSVTGNENGEYYTFWKVSGAGAVRQ